MNILLKYVDPVEPSQLLSSCDIDLRQQRGSTTICRMQLYQMFLGLLIFCNALTKIYLFIYLFTYLFIYLFILYFTVRIQLYTIKIVKIC